MAAFKFNVSEEVLVEQVQAGQPAMTIRYEPELLEIFGENAVLIEGVHFAKQMVYRPGSKVKCMFNDAGHKLWFSRNQVMTVIRTKSDGKAPYKLVLKTKGKISDFYSNDFRMVQGVRCYMAYSLIDVDKKKYSFNDILKALEGFKQSGMYDEYMYLINWAT